MLQAALNGPPHPGPWPPVPAAPAELARAAADAVRAGADELHVHGYGPDGRESLDPRDVAELLAALRAAVPGIPVGLSTGAWIVPDLARRVRTIGRWTSRPDYASVNFHEAGADLVARTLIELGVAFEAGLTEVAAAEAFLAADLAEGCFRILLEPADRDPDRALATVAAIEGGLSDRAAAIPRLLHGEGPTAWPLLRQAARSGQDVRIGLEDTDQMPDGSPARDNAALVAAARRIVEAAGRP